MISPGATSIEIPRNTSMRREPIRNDWHKSRATSCDCGTDNYSAKIDMLQQARSAKGQSVPVRLAPRTKKIAAEKTPRRFLKELNLVTPFRGFPTSVRPPLRSVQGPERIETPPVPRAFAVRGRRRFRPDNSPALAAPTGRWLRLEPDLHSDSMNRSVHHNNRPNRERNPKPGTSNCCPNNTSHRR